MQVSDYVVKKYGRIVMPYDEITNSGSDRMSLSDLFSVILSGNKTETAIAISERLIKDYGSKSIFKIRNPHELVKCCGISLSDAVKLVSVFEICDRQNVTKQTLIRGPEDIYDFLRDMAGYKKEVFHLLCLNTKNIVIHNEVVSVGTLSGTMVHPREVMSVVIQHNSGSFAVVHNHPSGEFEPSSQDDSITKMLKDAGDIMQIPLIDHVIIANNGYYSYNKERRI